MNRRPARRYPVAYRLFFAGWAAVFGTAFAVYFTTAPTGDGAWRGFNRLAGFALWQAGAALLAIGVLWSSRHVPATAPFRRLRAVPLALAALTAIGVTAMFVRMGA